MPRLYDYVLSDACYKVRLMLSLVGIAYEVVAIDVYPGREHDGAAFRALNPEGDVPVYEDGSLRLRDPRVILRHIAGRQDQNWLPEDESWLEQSTALMAPLSEARLVNLLGAPGDLEALRRDGRLALRRLEDHLTDRSLAGFDWVAAPRPSIADIALFPHVALSHDAGIGLEDFPALDLWQRRVRRLPHFVGMPGIPDYF